MDVPKITMVIPEKDMVLAVSFSDGSTKYFDCKRIKDRNAYHHRLENSLYFKNVRIDVGGHGVSWDDEVDISEHELYEHGVPQPPADK